jgi:hypothetical protein
MKKSYRKAAGKYPEIAQKTEYYMQIQAQTEHEKCTSIDRACDSTAQIMSAIAANIAQNDTDKKNLAGFGYHLGRFIYLADAYDDIEKDRKKGNYNPLLLNFQDVEQAKKIALENIKMSLGQASDFYLKLNISKYRDILDNVIYLGLPNFHNINSPKFKKNKNKPIEI